MKTSVELEKGIYSIDWIKHIHNSSPDWLADVTFLDYKNLQNHLNSPQDLVQIFAAPNLSIDYPGFQVWIIIDANTEQEGVDKACTLERSLKKAGLQTRYDQIVFGPNALLTCNKLKAKEPCDDEIAEDFQPETPITSSEVPLRTLSSAPKGEALTVPTNAALPPAPGALALPEPTRVPLTPAPRASPLPATTHVALPPAPGASALPEPTRVPLTPAPRASALPATTHVALPPAPGASALPEPTRVPLTPAPRASALPAAAHSPESHATLSSRSTATAHLLDSEKTNPKQKRNLPKLIPFDQIQRGLIEWLISAGFLTSLGAYLFMRYNKETKQKLTFIERFNRLFLYVFRFDGLNPENLMITSADGKTKPYTGSRLPFGLMLASFLGLPTRAESVIDGVPQFSGWQLLWNFLGVWVPVKETLTNKKGDLSFYQYRWTEKKIIQALLLVFKLTIILPIKVILIPFKFALNIIKLFLNVLLPLLSEYTALFNAQLFSGLIHHSFQITNNRLLTGTLIVLGCIPLAAMAIFQYALVWASRIGLAFTSPEQSARFAFALGRSLTIGAKDSTVQKFISNVMGGIGAILSLALSAVLWTIALPLALSALVTVIPSLLTAVTWISQLPFVATSLAWLSQWPLLTKLSVLLNSAVSTVGGGLAIAFGPIITPLAIAMSFQVSAAVMTVGTFLGMIGVPVAAILSRAADELSDFWARWIEQKPFASFGRLISRSESNNSKDSMPKSAPEKIFAYQAEAGREYIISTQALNLKNKQDEVLKALEVTGEKAEALFLRAKENKVHKSNEKVRFPTPVEQHATVDIPVLVR